MDSTISREEHEEYARRVEAEQKRMEDENVRQNKRIEALENNMNQIIVQQLTTLTTTIERLDISVGNLLKEQSELGERLKKLENQDGEKWRKAVWYVFTAILGAALGFVFSRIGLS